jgi:hypothetical protein
LGWAVSHLLTNWAGAYLHEPLATLRGLVWLLTLATLITTITALVKSAVRPPREFLVPPGWDTPTAEDLEAAKTAREGAEQRAETAEAAS